MLLVLRHRPPAGFVQQNQDPLVVLEHEAQVDPRGVVVAQFAEHRLGRLVDQVFAQQVDELGSLFSVEPLGLVDARAQVAAAVEV